MPIIPKYADLEKLTDEQLIQRYDDAATHTVVGTSFFLEELTRRSQQRQTDSMLSFTKEVRNMTRIITVLTVINVLLVLLTLLR